MNKWVMWGGLRCKLISIFPAGMTPEGPLVWALIVLPRVKLPLLVSVWDLTIAAGDVGEGDIAGLVASLSDRLAQREEIAKASRGVDADEDEEQAGADEDVVDYEVTSTDEELVMEEASDGAEHIVRLEFPSVAPTPEGPATPGTDEGPEAALGGPAEDSGTDEGETT